jgi:hypothetical protein
MKMPVRKRDLAMLLAGAAIAGLFITPVGAHVTTSVTHLWSKHIKPKVTSLVYTKAESNARYLGKTAKAADADKLDGKNSTDFASVAEGWHIVGDTGEPKFNLGDFALFYEYYGGSTPYVPGDACAWSNFDGFHEQAAFYKDADGTVHLNGLVKAAHGSSFACGVNPFQDGEDLTIFRLPAGYRPKHRVVLSTMSFADPMRVDIDPNGMVSIGGEDKFRTNQMEAARNWVTLSGLSFPAEAPAT